MCIVVAAACVVVVVDAIVIVFAVLIVVAAAKVVVVVVRGCVGCCCCYCCCVGCFFVTLVPIDSPGSIGKMLFEVMLAYRSPGIGRHGCSLHDLISHCRGVD